MEVRLAGTLDEITRLLGKDAKPWIPASVRTPETETPVIVCYKSRGEFVVGMGAYHGTRWQVYASSAKKVDFWRSLPNPPFALDDGPDSPSENAG